MSWKRATAHDLVLICVMGTLLFLPWVNLPITDADTAYYSIAAQRAVATGDWMTLRGSDGSLLDKPPLSIWPIAASYSLWGVHDWSTRAWQVVLSIGIVVLTYLTGRRFFDRDECLLASVILATSILFAYCTMVVQQDILNLFTYALFFHSFVLFWQTRRPAGYYLGWLASALAFLNRWHIALVIPAGVVLACIIVTRMMGRDDFGVQRLFGSWRSFAGKTALGCVIFLAVGGAWYIRQYAFLGRPFLELFFGGRNLAFFRSPGGREFSWLNATYIPQLVLAVLPWAVFLPESLGELVRCLRVKHEARGRELDGLVFASVWFLVALLVPHVSAWRVIRYLLPALPPLAMLMAHGVMRKLRERRRFAFAAIVSGCTMVVFLLLIVYMVIQPLDEGLRPYAGLILPFCVTSAVLFGAFSGAVLCRRERAGVVILAVLSIGSYVALFGSVSRNWDEISPWRSFGLESRSQIALQSATELAWYRNPDSKLPYGVPSEAEKVVYEHYVGRPVPFVEDVGEFVGASQSGRALVVMRADSLSELAADHSGLRLRRVLTHPSGWMLATTEVVP